MNIFFEFWGRRETKTCKIRQEILISGWKGNWKENWTDFLFKQYIDKEAVTTI